MEKLSAGVTCGLDPCAMPSARAQGTPVTGQIPHLVLHQADCLASLS